MSDKTALVIGASMAELLAARILTGHFERVLSKSLRGTKASGAAADPTLVPVIA